MPPARPALELLPASSRPRRDFVSIHTQAPGRLRLTVRGLYRNPELGRRLQRELQTLPGLRMLQVSDLTGRLLLVLDPAADPQAAADAVEACVASGGIPPRRWRPPAPLDPGAVPATEGLHGVSATDASKALGTSLRLGLDPAEAAARLARIGPNRLPPPQARSSWAIFLAQYQNLPAALLGGSALISLLTGGLADAVVIGGVLAINGWVGFRSEAEAERTIASLQRKTPIEVSVYRGGRLTRISHEELVPGDLVRLEPGTQVGADIRLLRTARLRIDESPLTGESEPVRKRAAFRAQPDTVLADRLNMAHMGTTVAGGSGVGVVAATGTATALGAIDALIGSAQPPATPMQRQLDHLGARLSMLSAGVCLGVFGLGMARGYGGLAMLKAAVSLGVAAIPEGLGTVATTSLAKGVRDLGSRRVAVRRLDAVETLGAIQAICLDKTGTLTENRMTVVSLQVEDTRLNLNSGDRDQGRWTASASPTLKRLWEVAALCNDASLEHPAGNGSSTELALVHAAAAAGIDVEALRGLLPRQATRKREDLQPYMATYHSLPDGRTLTAVKGSPTHVLGLCHHQLRQGELVALDPTQRKHLIAANDAMAADSLRVLGLAYADKSEPRNGLEDLVWLGLVGMADPIRSGVDRLMARFHRAGVRTIMITGDQVETACAIGQRLNLGEGDGLKVLEAGDLERLPPAALAREVGRVHIFARVTPAHKLRIVQALQSSGLVVAMTGDGINDGPALRAADIGIAMGHGGTDVARATADVVLEDDNLHTLLMAMEQGRTLYGNIRKAIRYLVATNCSEILVMAGGVAFGLGAPLTPMQLLWINLVTDIFPALALTRESPATNTLQQPPRDATQPIIGGRDLRTLGVDASIMAAAGLAAYAYGRGRYGAGLAASGIAFQTLAGAQLLHAYAARSERESLFGRGTLPRNRTLDLAIGTSLGLQAATQFLPSLRRLLGLAPLGLVDLAVIGIGAVAPLLIGEARKSRSATMGAAPGAKPPARPR